MASEVPRSKSEAGKDVDHEAPRAADRGAARPGRCGPRAADCIPTGYRQETVHILKLAGPVIVSQMMVYLISFVSTVFCGHMGKTELAGVALSIATYGSGNLRRVGVILQRGILILLLACFPCWALLVNTEPILLAVRQSPEVASLSQFYVQIFMPALPVSPDFKLMLEPSLCPSCSSQDLYPLLSFAGCFHVPVAGKGIIWPQVITGVIGNILNAIINYVFLFVLDMGVGGSAVANVISQYSLAVSLCIYINCRGLHKATWQGWSWECLQEWGPFIKLAIPSMLMMCLEWWMFEVGGFLAGIISEEELGAQSIVYELATLAYMFPLGFSVAASVRVGNSLGAGDIEQAKLTSKVSLGCAIIVSFFVGGSLGIPKDVVGYIFTKEPDIVQRVAVVMIIYSFFHVCDATACVTGGVIRGAGKQSIGALCNLVGYYFIGFPIGVSLMFAAGMGIVGLWVGLLICVLIQAAFFIIFLSKLNWTKASEEAQVRAGVQVVKRKDSTEMEHLEGGLDAPQCTAFPVAGETVQTPDIHVGGATTVGVVLSRRQLALRRGLTVLFMVSILMAAVFLKQLLVDILRH
ncbi:Multidrug and toxin extrusion protein 1 [Merluccius polli]|uniref:Multidrug and toxin extrusion protein n=1 Tax=Merluccius polli TaxID=89951 RepID=A0AA47P7D3_MERPO|nr:Multidrug and toxin extrusion protein 1 [Merluccius polli]